MGLIQKFKDNFIVKPETDAEGKRVKHDLAWHIDNFLHGQPHEKRRLGDLYVDNDSGLYKHREWRGVKDTMYYFHNIWLYNYAHMVTDILKYGGGPLALVDFVKGTMRYRWMGQTYLTAMHWFDRGLEGMRGEILKGSAWHYRGLVSASLEQIVTMFIGDKKINGHKVAERYDKQVAHNETVSGSVFYPFRDELNDIPAEMIPYFVTCHCNNHTVLNYIDAAQSIGLPGDPCPMCQAEYGLILQDDLPDFAPTMVTTNEACDGSVGTSVLQDWFINKPLYAFPQPMRYDDPLVQENMRREMEEFWKFLEDQYGVKFSWDSYVKYAERQNELTRFEYEKWDVDANTPYYPINGVAQALYRIFQTQRGDRDIWHEIDGHVRKIMNKTVQNKIVTLPKTRHRAIAWSCAPLFYSNWCTWAYNAWGINCVINMDSLMFDKIFRTDTYEHALEDLADYNEMAPMRAMAVGGYEHVFQLWEYMERFNCDMVIMYDQLACKGMQGIKGMFEDEFRKRNIPAIWLPHTLPDKRTVSRKEIRGIINDYMSTVMREEPLDPTLLELDDDNSW